MVDPRAWGVEAGYWDVAGGWHDASAATTAAILASLGADPDAPGSADPAGPGSAGTAGPGRAGTAGPASRGPLVIRADRPRPDVAHGTLCLEDGTELRVEGTLPRELPLGYHHLVEEDSEDPQLLVVCPGRCPAPPPALWGWAAQLYAARSKGSWGIGDLGDLRWLARWSASQGAGMVMINPLGAPTPGSPLEPSPYFAGTRCFNNPLYLRIEDIPGGNELGELGEVARALNEQRLIDRDRVWALKSEALRRLFERFEADGDFDRYRAERGAALRGFALFSALSERFGTRWRQWPFEYRHPARPGVAAFATAGDGAARIRYYEWLQWQLDRQLAGAGREIGLVQDLAIGVNPDGSDAWWWQDVFAPEVRVGAPPDEFNAAGQDWGLPPWDPWKLRAADYQPFIETVRAGFRHSQGLRLDHVMGLFRLFWIPDQSSPADGAYVRYPHADLLGILSLEAQRASAYVIGEDLGTVEDEVRVDLAERRVLSYRLLWFEPERPGAWPPAAVGAVTTHDLPTVTGVWTGEDARCQERAGLIPNLDALAGLRRRLREWASLDDGDPPGRVVPAAYRALADAPCAILAATLEDAFAVAERPNLPGTTEQAPNWRLALPRPLEDLEHNPVAQAIAEALARPGRNT